MAEDKNTNERWVNELLSNIRAKTAHTFLLHGNVSDDTIFKDEFLCMHELLPRLEILRESAFIVFFNIGTGVRFASKETKNAFLQLIVKPFAEAAGVPHTETYFEEYKYQIVEVLKWFDQLLLMSWNDVDTIIHNDNEQLKSFFAKKKPKKDNIPFAVVVFEYQESGTPPESATGSSMLDRRVVVVLQWWARSPSIQKTRNVIFFIVDWIGEIAPKLREQSKGIIPIEVPFPDRQAQENTIALFRKNGIYQPTNQEGELTIEELARHASALSRVELAQIFKKTGEGKSGGVLTGKALFEKKARIIETRLGNLVRIRKPDWGWEVIGGMDERVALAMLWADAMKRGNIARLPKGGILMIGAPGTGKTVFAEAFAHEVDVPFMEVMNTFNQFVGESERHMQLLIDTAYAQRPCVLFIDEINDLLLPRGQVYHGDSGVYARSSRMLMQFFSDPKIHGQVIIFAATNRPDLLDSAVKRAGRFGIKIPFLIPTKESRPSIWKALLRKEIIRFSLSGLELDVSAILDNDAFIQELSLMSDFWEDNGMLRCGPLDKDRVPCDEDVVALTGAEMEDIIGLAFQPFLSDEQRDLLGDNPAREKIVKELSELFPMGKHFALEPEMLKEAMEHYLPHEDIASYQAMNNLALLALNDDRMLPKEYRRKARELRVKHAQQRGAGTPYSH